MRHKLISIPTLLVSLLAADSALAGPCRGSGGKHCFILRAKVAHHLGLEQTYGLEVLRQLDAEDPELVLVAVPASILPEVTEQLVREDPNALGFERVTPATVSESSADSAVDARVKIFSSHSASGEHSGALAPHFSATLWNGYADQPAVAQVNVAAAHALPQLEARGEGAVVAIIDTGVDPDHALLQGALVPGYDFLLDQPGIASEWDGLQTTTAAETRTELETIAEQSHDEVVAGSATTSVERSYGAFVEQSYDGFSEGLGLPGAFGHGTMVAGIVRLVAPAAKIMPLRVFDANGGADLNDIVEAVHFAVRNGANVINMSFSTTGHSPELHRAIRQAIRHRVVCVTSAGNSGEESLTYPAAYLPVFGVASVDAQNELSEFSSFGPDVTLLAAPGEEVVTAFPGGIYAAAWGTSFSAAFVSGTAALFHRILPTEIERIKPRNAWGAFEESSYQPDPTNPTDDWGSGILDVFEAFGYGLAAE